MTDAAGSGALDLRVELALEALRRHPDDPAMEAVSSLLLVLSEDQRDRRDLFEHAPDPYVVTDGHGAVQHLNRRAVSLFGPSSGERSIVDLAHPDDRGAVTAALGTLDDDRRHALTLRFVTDDGERNFETHARSLRGERILWLLRDTSGFDELRDGLLAVATQDRAAIEELNQLDQLRSAFLLTVSHDLRTPLATIVGLADLLVGQALPQRARENVTRKLRDVARQVLNDFNDILDVERIERGDHGIVRRPVDVARVLWKVLSTVDVGSHPLELELPPTPAEVDPVLLSRMVHNLLQNAARHTPTGTTIWLRCGRDDGHVHVTVEDDGPGVTSEQRDTVFELFSRERSRPGGLGIGLHLVRCFAELHGGEVQLDEGPSGGASFRIRLPDPSRSERSA